MPWASSFALAIKRDGYYWGFLTFAVGYGGAMRCG